MSFNPSSGGGSGTVESVAGTSPIVSDLDPVNPVISLAPISNANVDAGADIEIGKLLDGGVLGMLPIAQGGTGAVWTTLFGDAVLAEDGEVTIAANAVTNGKLRDSAALSVIGRSANSVGDPADIAATAATDAVLRESGGALGFGTIATGGIAAAAVTFAKIQNLTAARVMGRGGAGGTGAPEELTLGTAFALAATTINFAPTASVDFLQQQALQFTIENRTSDPGSPVAGQIWLRTDL